MSVLSDRRVLIVEDQYLIADDMRRAVVSLGGVPVGPFASLRAARAGIGAPPDVAVLDINLDGEEVFDLADDLITRGVPILFATGYDSGVLPDRYRAFKRVQKPVSAAVLGAALGKLLEK